jgi:hypothetical protein
MVFALAIVSGPAARLGVLAIGGIVGLTCVSPRGIERTQPPAVSGLASASTTPALPLREARDVRDGASPSSPPAGELPPLEGTPVETWRIGDVEIVAALPVGAREKRPVVVAVHGSRDRPDAACARWRRTVASWAFVVCPKGVPWRRGLAWGSPAVVAERIDRALAALHEHHHAHVAEGPVVYAGWSLGGTLGPRVVALRPGVFDPVVLTEVGHTRLDATSSAAELRSGRASQVIISCATRRCAAFGKRVEHAWGNTPGLALVDAGIGRGHVFDDRMSRAVGASLVRSTASDPRWRGLAVALEAPPTGGDAGAPATRAGAGSRSRSRRPLPEATRARPPSPFRPSTGSSLPSRPAATRCGGAPSELS